MQEGTTETGTQNRHRQTCAGKSEPEEPTLFPIGDRVSAKFYGDDLFYNAIVLGHDYGRYSVMFEGYEDDEPPWTSHHDVRDFVPSIEPQPAIMPQNRRRANRALVCGVPSSYRENLHVRRCIFWGVGRGRPNLLIGWAHREHILPFILCNWNPIC